MAVASWKGAIRFGPLLQFGVAARAVDRETVFRYNTHHAVDGGRLHQQPMVCDTCGEPVEKADTIRGYNGVPGVDEDYLDSLEREKTGLMELDGLVPASQIEPRWFIREYDVVPEKGAEKAYVLFLRTLERMDRVAIGKVVVGGKEQIVAVRPRQGVLAMNLLHWPDEIKSDSEARNAIAGIEISDKELAMGEQLAGYMLSDFDPTKYVNEYAAAVGSYLEAFTAGATPPVIEHRELPSVTKSLEDALAASLASLGAEPKQKAGKAA